MLKIVNAFIKEHRTELGLKGYSKMSYLEKLKYLEGKVKGTKYEREIAKLTNPKVDEGIKKVLEKSGRGQNVRVKKDKEKVRKEKVVKAAKDLSKKVPPEKKEEPKKDSLDKLSIKQLIKGIDKFYAPTKVKHPKEPKKEKLLAFIKKKNIPRSDFDDKAETIDKNLFLQVSQVLAEQGKSKGYPDKLKVFDEIDRLSVNQTKKIINDFIFEKRQRKIRFSQGFSSKDKLKEIVAKEQIPLSKFKISEKKETKQKYFLEINTLGAYDDLEEGEVPSEFQGWKVERSSESGMTKFSKMMTKAELKQYKEDQEEFIGQYSNLYRETKKSRIYSWEGL